LILVALSEYFVRISGCPGFEDLQDGYLDIVLIVELRIMMISGKEYLVNA
jgi:hypothetical protein